MACICRADTHPNLRYGLSRVVEGPPLPPLPMPPPYIGAPPPPPDEEDSVYGKIKIKNRNGKDGEVTTKE